MDEQNLTSHNDTNREIHESLLLSVINMLTQERLENRKIIENQNKKIECFEERLGKLELENKEIQDQSETQSNLLEKSTKEIESLKNDNANLNQKLQTQNDYTLNIHQQLETLERKEFEKTLEDQREEIENLKTFAKAVSKLHETLCDVHVREKDLTFRYLYNKDYSTHSGVNEWNDFVQQINTNEEYSGDCYYLYQMVQIINRYQKTVYTKSWNMRLWQFAFAIDNGAIINDHIKLCTLSTVKYISISRYNNNQHFDMINNIDMRWVKHSNLVASYLSWHKSAWCFNIAILLPSCYKNINILHWKEESKKLRLPTNNGLIVRLNDGESYCYPFVMLQLER